MTFDTDLLNEPEDKRRTIILHELLHLKYPNHGRMFRVLLRSYLKNIPDIHPLEKKLAGVNMKIQISNLSHDLTEEELRAAFAAYGEVKSAKIVKGKSRGKAKGTATVEMPDAAAAELAIQHLQGKNLKGSPLKISVRYEGGRPGGSRRHAGDREEGARGGRRF